MSTFIRDRLAELRGPDPTVPEQHRVITVRLPREQHERLKALARANAVSLNAFCIVAFDGAENALASEGAQS